MSAMEIALLVLGAVFFAASFIVPEMRAASEDAGISKDEMKQMLEEELNSAKSQMKDTVEETVSYAVQRTERSLEKVSNEKIMAVNEYSDTVLEEIDKNHKEALFLYDMLNDKEIELKNIVRKAEQTKQDMAKMPNLFEREEALQSAADFAIPNDTFTETEPVDSPSITNSIEISFPSTADGGRNQNEQILRLHKEGKSNVAIAKELGMGVGEVKLVIDLFEGVNV